MLRLGSFIPRSGNTVVNVALDVMGGDLGVEEAVRGAALVSRESTSIFVFLVGDSEEISKALETVDYDPRRVQVMAADGFVAMDESPRVVLERPDCSVMTAARLVREGRADAMVSSGNTGALVLAASHHLERLPGIRRAALAAVHPTERRHGPKGDPFALMLDVGATVTADADTLVGFAVMGSVYSSIISEIPSPSVALLSNGVESKKGTPAILEANQKLKKSQINFAGNVEGLDIPKGTVDVVVCDGFLGNVVLKMLEGVGEVFTELAKDASSRRLKWKIGLTMLSSGLRRLKRLTDWKMYGGAPVLGLSGVVIKAHGRSESRAIRNAIKVAAKAVDGKLIERIQHGVAEFNRSHEG